MPIAAPAEDRNPAEGWPTHEQAPWFAEDLPVGVPRTLGRWRLTAEEIVDFGRQWDPLPFHVDPEAAAASPFGGLIASGLHTMGVAQRLLVEGIHRHVALVAGRGASGVRLPAPARAGALVEVGVVLVAVEPYRDDRAAVRADIEVRGVAEGELLLAYEVDFVVLRRG